MHIYDNIAKAKSHLNKKARTMTGFVGIDVAICNKALKIVRPSIENMIIANGAVGGHLAVFFPRPLHLPPNYDGDFHESFYQDVWDLPYETLAINKGEVSLDTGLPSSVVQQRYPYLYERGWVKWGGTAVGERGLVIAFSGLKQEFDEMISEMYLSALTAVCRYAMRDVMTGESHYLGR